MFCSKIFDLVSQESVRLKVRVYIFLCLVLIREFELWSPTHVSTSSGSSCLFIMGIFRNLAYET